MAHRGFSPRKMMEKAVEVMLQSVPEPRQDGKASPKVGAVLVTSPKLIGAATRVVTACRGELRDGDHAEFTLLERKCRDQNVAGSILFATLEPCAPGSRSHRKLGCAERIVLARIREVYVGIEDPDPTVDRKGIKYLQDNGVTVHMFDRDLQEQIRDANREFVAQALERAAAAREETPPQPIKLSPLEDAFDRTKLSDFSKAALERYRDVARIPEEVGSPEFSRRLALQGLLERVGDQWVPTGFGLLLFGKEPRLYMHQAGLLGTIHLPDGREELRDFIGPQVFAPGEAMGWLRDKLPDPVNRSEARRKPVNTALFELAREGIVNALVHRDYALEGAKCQVAATPETIVIRSPGQPLPPITLEQLQAFTAPMLSRNPILHAVFSQMELAEERGLGLKSMKQRAEQAGLPLPAYTWEAPYLVLTLYRRPEGVVQALHPKVLEALNADERVSWQFVAGKGTTTSAEIVARFGFDERKAQRILKKLQELKLVRRLGKGPTTHYDVVRG